jgi:hypothetical protein
MTRALFTLSAFLLLVPTVAPAALFSAQELFQIPFTPERDGLGARVEGGQFSYPKDFTIDETGRFYIYDSKKHRVARYSPAGRFEIGFNYPETARQVFAHADSHDNLWLLISDPQRGLYYGVYDPRGKRLRDGLFAQFDHFRLHLDDEYGLHLILSSSKAPSPGQMFYFDESTLLMKKEKSAPPPPEHHQIRKKDEVFYIDAVPGGSTGNAPPMSRVSNRNHQPVAQIQGSVIYVTTHDEVYTRVRDCQINVYNVTGSLIGQLKLPGLPSACHSIRFRPNGDIYQLDGLPNAVGAYTPEMTGMRMLRWERTR